MWTRVKDGYWNDWREGVPSKDVAGFKSRERNSYFVLKALRCMPESSLEEVDLSHVTLDADFMRELGRFKALTLLSVDFCSGTILPLPPSLTKLSWDGGEMDMRVFLPAIAKSNITELWMDCVIMDHDLVAAMIETSKLKRVSLMFRKYLTDADVARYVLAAERCDVERIHFWRQRLYNVDLRRTRKLINFGNSDHVNDPDHKDYKYAPQIKIAMDVRRVLVVLGARSGPVDKFLRRDGDHACLSRVFRYM